MQCLFPGLVAKLSQRTGEEDINGRFRLDSILKSPGNIWPGNHRLVVPLAGSAWVRYVLLLCHVTLPSFAGWTNFFGHYRQKPARLDHHSRQGARKACHFDDRTTTHSTYHLPSPRTHRLRRVSLYSSLVRDDTSKFYITMGYSYYGLGSIGSFLIVVGACTNPSFSPPLKSRHLPVMAVR